MNQSQTPKPAYNPGDRVLSINPSMSIGEPGTVEVVFIGFDPEQPTVALVRDVGNVNAPIRGVHNSYIKAVPKPEHKVAELFARRNKNQHELVVIEHVSDFDPMVDQSLRIIDARITEDGLLQVKVDMTESVERDAILAALEDPTSEF